MQEALEQRGMEAAQLFAQPAQAGHGACHIEAVGLRRIQHKMEAKLDDEQGMLEEEAVQLAGVHEPFALADQKRFEVGTLGMGRPSTRRTLVKEIGRGHHSKKLLLLGEMGFLLRCKRSFAAVKGTGRVCYQ